MKSNQKRGGELFGMSFLDVICCGFGAMVLLVLLSKTDVAGGGVDTDVVKSLLSNITTDTERKTASEQQRATLTEQRRQLESKLAELAGQAPDLAELNRRLKTERAKANRLRLQTGTQISIASREKLNAVGGIPVDADYIIFIVDTSGSMQTIWPRVINELENVISIHPRVKGFQIMNDNGKYLVSSYAGRWIPDTPGRRKSILAAMQSWSSFSSSSPVEGLQQALRTYAKRTDKLSIYVFGDDYTGGSYDTVLTAVEKLNRNPKTGKPLAQIHGIGFPHIDTFQYQAVPGAHQAATRFATLMREVARRNDGAFIALN